MHTIYVPYNKIRWSFFRQACRHDVISDKNNLYKKKSVLLVPPELSPIGIDPSTSKLAGGYLVHMVSVDKMAVSIKFLYLCYPHFKMIKSAPRPIAIKK